MKKYKYVIYPLAIATCYGLVADFCHNKTKGFQVGKICTYQSFSSEQKPFSPEEAANIIPILNQPFSYLKKGRFCFVFLSEDQKYVIKLLQKDKIVAPFWATRLFPTFCEQLIEKKAIQKEKNITSYRLAFEKLCHQSQTLCLHLGQTKQLKTFLHLLDPLHIKHNLAADDTLFILQKKANPFIPYFQASSLEKQKSLLSEFAYLLWERAKLGIADGDLSPRYNIGISNEGSLVAFDLDSLRMTNTPKDAETCYKHMANDAKKMMRWLKDAHSDLALYLEQDLIRLSQTSLS